jgi:hypothetical protein
MPTVVSGSFHSRSLAQRSAASGRSCGLDGARYNHHHLDSRAHPWAGRPRDDETRIDDLISGKRVHPWERDAGDDGDTRVRHASTPQPDAFGIEPGIEPSGITSSWIGPPPRANWPDYKALTHRFVILSAGGIVSSPSKAPALPCRR